VSLTAEVNDIRSRDDFVRFVQNLSRDLAEKPDRWENKDLVSYLEAVAAWTADMEGYYENQNEPLTEQPNWKTFGQILLAAKFYE
jgi:hypothetical protein